MHQELRAEAVAFYPKHNKKSGGCFRFAFLRLSEPVNVKTTVSAAPGFSLAPGSKVSAFQMNGTLQMGLFDFVDNAFCTELELWDLKGFCMFSPSVQILQGMLTWMGSMANFKDQSMCSGDSVKIVRKSSSLFLCFSVK